jgi:hypothetical protein
MSARASDPTLAPSWVVVAHSPAETPSSSTTSGLIRSCPHRRPTPAGIQSTLPFPAIVEHFSASPHRATRSTCLPPTGSPPLNRHRARRSPIQADSVRSRHSLTLSQTELGSEGKEDDTDLESELESEETDRRPRPSISPSPLQLSSERRARPVFRPYTLQSRRPPLSMTDRALDPRPFPSPMDRGLQLVAGCTSPTTPKAEDMDIRGVMSDIRINLTPSSGPCGPMRSRLPSQA